VVLIPGPDARRPAVVGRGAVGEKEAAVRLTKAMLDAMDTALAELLAGCGVQGVFNEAEADEIIRNAHKAQAWVW
jgi:hypothetical protein